MYIHVDPNSKAGNAIIIIGVPIFTIFLYLQILYVTRAVQSTSWPVANGVVIDSKIDKVYTADGTHDNAKVNYKYAVANKAYENDTIEFGLFRGMLSWGHAANQVQNHPVGQAVLVHYNPREPEISCLNPGGFGWEDGFMFIVCAAGVGMGMKRLNRLVRRIA